MAPVLCFKRVYATVGSKIPKWDEQVSFNQASSNELKVSLIGSQVDVMSAGQKNIEERVRKNLQALYATERDGVHATDLTLCLRQSTFKKLNPLDLSTKQIGYFFASQREFHGRELSHKTLLSRESLSDSA